MFLFTHSLHLELSKPNIKHLDVMDSGDGRIINFVAGGVPVKPKVKVKGGRWRDRLKMKKELQQSPSTIPSESEKHEKEAGKERPLKKRRTEDGHNTSNRRPAERALGDKGGGNDIGLKRGPVSRQVTSSLFTSNPTPVTKFDEERPEEALVEPSNAPLSAETFTSLGVCERVVTELDKLGLSKPTAIQKKTIPVMIKTSDDAFIQAQTGSGKTLAYVLPMVHRVLALSQQGKIHRRSGIFGIILAPTRELAKQVYSVLANVLQPTPWLVAAAITGGQDMHSEKARIRKGVNFLVATPGRLSHHIQNTRTLMVNTVRWLILDEGDRLIEQGFEEQIKTIVERLRQIHMSTNTYDGVSLSQLPERRVTVLCSATMKMTVQRLGEVCLKDAVHIEESIEDGNAEEDEKQQKTFAAPTQLKQSYIIVPAKLRLVTLLSFLKLTFARKGSVMKAMVFVSCAHSVNFHFELLRAAGSDTGSESEHKLTSNTVAKAAYITSSANRDIVLHKLYGDLEQPVRTATLKSFSDSKEPALLITTDIASRGLDIPSVDLVVELDPAFSVEEHVHRVGRTARAGRPGKAVLFLLPGAEEGYVSLLPSGATAQLYDTTLHRGLSIPWEDFPFETHANMSQDQSYTDKAESLQLHFEQRLLNNRRLLDLGRNGFKSHIRAYATHVKPERGYFDMAELHLGHVAKSFALREAPGGIGNGLDKRASKKSRAKRAKGDGIEGAEDGTAGSRDMYERLSRMLVNSGASEFNIG
jgi:ATP-dependent RNA helicase DDX31/DBP7